MTKRINIDLDVLEFWRNFSDIVNKHGPEIAVMIAEWWHAQKAKQKTGITTCEEFISKDYESSEEGMEPLKITEDYSQIIIQRPDGKRCIVCKEREIPKAEKQQLPRKQLGCCNTCNYEIYFEYEDDGYILYTRDCICITQDANNYFNRNVILKISKAEIMPAMNCPFWRPLNGLCPVKVKVKRLPV